LRGVESRVANVGSAAVPPSCICSSDGGVRTATLARGARHLDIRAAVPRWAFLRELASYVKITRIGAHVADADLAVVAISG